MDAWVIWLIAAAALGIGEMHQGGFYLAPFAFGAAVATVVSLVGVGAALSAVVLERIANHEGVGCVKIDGEVWTARSFDEDEVIDAGERVEVVEIRGATALVMP